MNSTSLPPPPRGKGIDPSDADHFLTSETEDEVTIGITTEGETYIYETEMLHAFLMCLFHGIPNSHGIRVQHSETLSS
jgi:hypothetical protein